MVDLEIIDLASLGFSASFYGLLRFSAADGPFLVRFINRGLFRAADLGLYRGGGAEAGILERRDKGRSPASPPFILVLFLVLLLLLFFLVLLPSPSYLIPLGFWLQCDRSGKPCREY